MTTQLTISEDAPVAVEITFAEAQEIIHALGDSWRHTRPKDGRLSASYRKLSAAIEASVGAYGVMAEVIEKVEA